MGAVGGVLLVRSEARQDADELVVGNAPHSSGGRE